VEFFYFCIQRVPLDLSYISISPFCLLDLVWMVLGYIMEQSGKNFVMWVFIVNERKAAIESIVFVLYTIENFWVGGCFELDDDFIVANTMMFESFCLVALIFCFILQKRIFFTFSV
jgi:hypothetical protein